MRGDLAIDPTKATRLIEFIEGRATGEINRDPPSGDVKGRTTSFHSKWKMT
jgi:hypothetical protein